METKKISRIDMEQVDIPLSFGETKRMSPLFQGERGITLVALIITVIILVILAAVSIAAVYNSKIVNYAINGTQDYGAQAIKENKVLDETTKLIDSAVENLSNMLGGNKPDEPPQTEKTKEELSQTSMIGKYVDYKPQGANYTVDKTYSGTDADQTFAANNDMKWRIWGVEGNKLLLISEALAGDIELKGAEGYNNAVKLLNDACAQAYGNSSYGSAVKARSINQDDIDKVTNMTTDAQRRAAYSDYNYGILITPSNNSYYPAIYGQEPSKSGGESLGRSEQSSWYSGNVSGSSTGYWTYYQYDITTYATQTMYDALLTNMSASSTSGTDNNTAYWVASRCVWITSSLTQFCVFRVGGGSANAPALYWSNDTTIDPVTAVRPMVEVDLDAVSIGSTGIGTNTAPYSMAKK